MSAAKYTAGPWTACEHGDYSDYDGSCVVVLGNDLRVCVVLGDNTDETIANARLIAAAPALLEALKISQTLLKKTTPYPGQEDLLSEAVAMNAGVITKAEGAPL